MKPLDPKFIERCNAMLDEAGLDHDRDLAADMINTVLKLTGDDPGRGEMKLMARSFKELRYAFKVFKPYRSRRKVSMFGSARTPADDPDYIAAVQFGKQAADAGFMVITGAGGGIMAAGHEGAGQAASFGVAIRLPFEQKTNEFIAKDEKLIHFRYFFSRKLVFVKETHAIALFPGGFGTHDEGFEVLTLVQTGRADPLPIVMVEAKGGDYWPSLDQFIRKQLLKRKLICEEDTSLYFITDDVEAGVEHIRRFYRNYHSLRYYNDQLVLRMKHAPNGEELERIRERYGDIVTKGTFEVVTSVQADNDTELVPEMPRMAFSFNRRSLARLRMLIDELNVLPSLPMETGSPGVAQTGSDKADREVGEIAEEEPIKLAGPGRVEE